MIIFYRISHFLYEIKIPVIPKIIQGIIFVLFNSKVPPDVQIGKGSYFVCKGIGVSLIYGTTIGYNCAIGLRFSTVRNFPYKNVPKIGNNVWTGPNVVIAGPVVVDDNVIIAANSFVNKSIPSGAIVAGNPAKIIGWSKNLDYNIFENPKYKDGIAPYMAC
jgi:serine O-acetyltransferase